MRTLRHNEGRKIKSEDYYNNIIIIYTKVKLTGTSIGLQCPLPDQFSAFPDSSVRISNLFAVPETASTACAILLIHLWRFPFFSYKPCAL